MYTHIITYTNQKDKATLTITCGKRSGAIHPQFARFVWLWGSMPRSLVALHITVLYNAQDTDVVCIASSPASSISSPSLLFRSISYNHYLACNAHWNFPWRGLPVHFLLTINCKFASQKICCWTFKVPPGPYFHLNYQYVDIFLFLWNRPPQCNLSPNVELSGKVHSDELHWIASKTILFNILSHSDWFCCLRVLSALPYLSITVFFEDRGLTI